MLFSMASAKKYHLLKFALNASIHTLLPRQREVIVSHYWGGRTITEIAASTGVSRQSICKTMRTALSKIKTNLTSGSFRRQVMATKEMLAS